MPFDCDGLMSVRSSRWLRVADGTERAAEWSGSVIVIDPFHGPDRYLVAAAMEFIVMLLCKLDFFR